MKFLFFSLFAIFSLNACSNSKKVTENKQEEIVFKDVAKGDSLFASLERTVCYGRCPVYEIKIYNSGDVIYHGKRFVEREGKYKTKISKQQMLKFIEVAKRIGYMDMKDKYDGPITDLPATITSIVIDGKRKTVYKRYNAPTALKEFEKLFDDLLTSQKWVKINDEIKEEKLNK